jgi:hypothetical protein
MDEEKPQITLGRLEWGVILALVMSAGTTLFSAGIVYGDVRDHERRIEVIEGEGKGVSDRLARMETNIQFLVDRAAREDQRTGR